MKLIHKYIQQVKSLLSFNLLKTIYYNFRIFPIKIASKLPLKIYYNVDFEGVRRNFIQVLKLKNSWLI